MSYFKVPDRMMIGPYVFQLLPKPIDIPLATFEFMEKMPFRLGYRCLENSTKSIVRRPHAQVLVKSNEWLSQRRDNAMFILEGIR